MRELAVTEETPEKEAWEDRFLSLLSDSGNVTQSAEGASVARVTVWRHRQRCPAFAARYQEAMQVGVGALEDEARRRALAGSDTLIIFLLKSHLPEVYRERIENRHAGADGGPIRIAPVWDIAKLTDEQLDQYRAIAAAAEVPTLDEGGS